ncbi:MAG: cytochrome C [Rhodocyclales bacterium CG17_big_fil_post_rev_8_21_14_2_50_68_7]|nr:MAG: cytochrome C [Rhodocyclales bacterium CG17_big_fil_post_rev_8_21_14_2_50_68_7]
MPGGMRRHLRERGGALLAGAACAVLAIAAVIGGEAALSTTQFCVSCHSMSCPAKELKKSSHYGALGANPGCKDCHIPQGLENFHLAVATHVIDGARELVLEFRNDYSDIKKFNARRAGMAHDARMNLKRWDSVTCRSCHRDPQPPGADAKAAHDKMRTNKATCIDCHQNLVHKEVPETDLDASLAQGKRVLKKED